MLRIKLSNEMIEKVNNNNLKAVEAIRFIMANTDGYTNKDIMATSTRDLIFPSMGNKSPVSATFDMWCNDLVLRF